MGKRGAEWGEGGKSRGGGNFYFFFFLRFVFFYWRKKNGRLTYYILYMYIYVWYNSGHKFCMYEFAREGEGEKRACEVRAMGERCSIRDTRRERKRERESTFSCIWVIRFYYWFSRGGREEGKKREFLYYSSGNINGGFNDFSIVPFLIGKIRLFFWFRNKDSELWTSDSPWIDSMIFCAR